MKKLVILGAGCGGTMMANKMRKHLDRNEWDITIIDRDNNHDYQPGYLFVPFGINSPKEIRKTKREFIKPGLSLSAGNIKTRIHFKGTQKLNINQTLCLKFLNNKSKTLRKKLQKYIR